MPTPVVVAVGPLISGGVCYVHQPWCLEKMPKALSFPLLNQVRFQDVFVRKKRSVVIRPVDDRRVSKAIETKAKRTCHTLELALTEL